MTTASYHLKSLLDRTVTSQHCCYYNEHFVSFPFSIILERTTGRDWFSMSLHRDAWPFFFRSRKSKYFSFAMLKWNKPLAACALRNNCIASKDIDVGPFTHMIPKHYLTSLSTAEKNVCKQDISATFVGMRTIFIQAMPKIFCCVNWPLVTIAVSGLWLLAAW